MDCGMARHLAAHRPQGLWQILVVFETGDRGGIFAARNEIIQLARPDSTRPWHGSVRAGHRTARSSARAGHEPDRSSTHASAEYVSALVRAS